MEIAGNVSGGKATIAIHYSGTFDSLNLRTLVGTQRAFLDLVDDVLRSVEPGIDVKLLVTETRQGSFEIVTDVITCVHNNLPVFEDTIEAIGTMKVVFRVIKDVIELVRHAKGGKITTKELSADDSLISIVNDNGEIIEVTNKALDTAKRRSRVVKSVNRLARELRGDPQVDALTAEVRDGVVESRITFAREDYEVLSKRPLVIARNDYTEEQWTQLYLRKIDLYPDDAAKWDFMYDGKSLKNVLIRDASFLESVRLEGRKFGAGDSIRCLLRTYYVAGNDEYLPVPKHYEVSHIEFVPTADDGTLSLFDGEH